MSRRNRMTMIRTAAAAAVIVALVVAAPRLWGSSSGPAAEARPQTVSMSAVRSSVVFGTSATVQGTVSAAATGARVTVVDDTGSVVATAATDGSGSFTATFAPERRTTVTARWADVVSDPVVIKVRATARVALTTLDLEDGASIAGRAQPAVADSPAEVELRRDGHSVARDAVTLDPKGKFSTTLPLDGPGSYRARVTYRAPGVRTASATSAAKRAVAPPLEVGATGGTVRALEEQLAALDYYLPTVDGSFDETTADAVRAFTKVQGLDRVGVATTAVWKALEDPKVPRARVREPGYHVEVDQTKQVMYTVDDGEISNIVHVSTGAGGATLDGTFSIYKKGGYGREYYPSYFDGRRAFHIWPEVPTYAASHGCVRLPFWTAQWYWDHTPVGTEVVIYH